jgi:hypothetical protein
MLPFCTIKSHLLFLNTECGNRALKLLTILVVSSRMAAAAPEKKEKKKKIADGPLDQEKNITITWGVFCFFCSVPILRLTSSLILLVPDWTNDVLQSTGLPLQFTVALGPSNVTPESAEWRFDFYVYSYARLLPGCLDAQPHSFLFGSISKEEAKTVPPNPAIEEVVIPKSSRALLWHDRGTWKPDHAAVDMRLAHGAYADAVLMNESKVAEEVFKCRAIVVRMHTAESYPLALRYVPGKPIPNQALSLAACGFIKVVIGCQYYLNLTL